MCSRMFSSKDDLGMSSVLSLDQSTAENEDLETFLQISIPPPVPADVYMTLQWEKRYSSEANGCWPTSSTSTSTSSDEDKSNNDWKDSFRFTQSPSFYASQTYYSTFDTPFDQRMSSLGCDGVSSPIVNKVSEACGSPICNPVKMEDRSIGIGGSKNLSSARDSEGESSCLGCSSNQSDLLPLQSSQHHIRNSYLPRYDHREIKNAYLGIGFIDTHCHLDFLFHRVPHRGGFEEFRKSQKETFPASYEGCVTVFCKPFSFAQEHLWKPIIEEEGIWAAFGCHPHHAYDYNDKAHFALVKILEHHKVRALGEIGLDYSNRNQCPKAVQHQVFKRQLKLAVEKSLPLVIHNRDAFDDSLEIMKKFVPRDHKIHMHCCMDSWEMAKAWLDTFPNLFIGLTNVITFPSATKVHDIARNIPLNRLLVETDAPYFVPRMMPRSTKWSHPGMAIHVAAQVAALKKISLKETLKAVRQNTANMYGI